MPKAPRLVTNVRKHPYNIPFDYYSDFSPLEICEICNDHITYHHVCFNCERIICNKDNVNPPTLDCYPKCKDCAEII